jgi:hypothetical protein
VVGCGHLAADCQAADRCPNCCTLPRLWSGLRWLSPAGAEAGRAAQAGNNGNGHAGGLVQCLRRNRTASTMITMITMTPKLMNMGYSSLYLGVSQR